MQKCSLYKAIDLCWPFLLPNIDIGSRHCKSVELYLKSRCTLLNSHLQTNCSAVILTGLYSPESQT